MGVRGKGRGRARPRLRVRVRPRVRARVRVPTCSLAYMMPFEAPASRCRPGAKASKPEASIGSLLAMRSPESVQQRKETRRGETTWLGIGLG